MKIGVGTALLSVVLFLWPSSVALGVYCSSCLWCDSGLLATCSIPSPCGICPNAIRGDCNCYVWLYQCSVQCDYTRCKDGVLVSNIAYCTGGGGCLYC
jgi:hypothetical protein